MSVLWRKMIPIVALLCFWKLQVFVFSLSCSIIGFPALSLNSDLLWQKETKSNKTPILISPDAARSFWEVWLSSSLPRRLLFQLFALVPLDPPSPLAGSGSRPTDRGRAEGGQHQRCRRSGEGGARNRKNQYGAHPVSNFPSGPPRLRPGASLARFRPRKCVWLHRWWKRIITHRWGWEVSYSSVSLWRYLLVPLAVHGKVGCSKHTLGKPSLKHWKAVWFFLRCATFPGKAKGLLNCYPPVRRLWCTGGWLGHWESRISWSSETSNHISSRFSFTEHETNPLFCFLISDIFL